jgi:hypothetical protein
MFSLDTDRAELTKLATITSLYSPWNSSVSSLDTDHGELPKLATDRFIP